jgi:uncharacterized membrane protein YdbT with pleckstrin-like domain
MRDTVTSPQHNYYLLSLAGFSFLSTHTSSKEMSERERERERERRGERERERERNRRQRQEGEEKKERERRTERKKSKPSNPAMRVLAYNSTGLSGSGTGEGLHVMLELSPSSSWKPRASACHTTARFHGKKISDVILVVREIHFVVACRYVVFIFCR